jgi:hypothetical protein
MSSPGDPNGPGHIVLEAPELDAYDIIKVDEQLGALSKIRFPYNGICRVIGIAPVNLPQYVRQNGTQGEQCADALQALLDALRAQGVTDSAPLMHRTLKAEADAMHLTSSISDLQFRADRRLRELTSPSSAPGRTNSRAAGKPAPQGAAGTSTQAQRPRAPLARGAQTGLW